MQPLRALQAVIVCRPECREAARPADGIANPSRPLRVFFTSQLSRIWYYEGMSVATTIKNLFNATEAAKYLGIDASLVRRYCRDGRIKAQLFGVDWAITKTDLDAFKAEPRRVGNPNLRKD